MDLLTAFLRLQGWRAEKLRNSDMQMFCWTSAMAGGLPKIGDPNVVPQLVESLL